VGAAGKKQAKMTRRKDAIAITSTGDGSTCSRASIVVLMKKDLFSSLISVGSKRTN
jgi:hypothetical protein